MTDQFKISATLREAQFYVAECFDLVTQEEPFILGFAGSQGSQFQDIRDGSRISLKQGALHCEPTTLSIFLLDTVFSDLSTIPKTHKCPATGPKW
jgi:hypothetical protein